MARTPQAQSNHDWMVGQLAGHFSGFGHVDVKADHVTHPNGRPVMISGHIPDVTAIHAHTGRPIICEVETDDSIGTAHTYQQLVAFRRAASQLGGTLHVALPFQHDIATAQTIVRRWGITVDQWWFGVDS